MSDTKLGGFNPAAKTAAQEAAAAAAKAAAEAMAAEAIAGAQKPWASKTVWSAAAMAALPFVPGLDGWFRENPEAYGILSGVVMIVLRAFTAGGFRIK